jgi:proteasome lid subunit RPN8/RPN11
VTLILPSPLAARIAAEAQAAFPHECCGLIEGVWHGGEARALALHPVPNRSTKAGRFEIDPALHLAAQRGARESGHVLIGCYHSHPNGRAEPSEADRSGAGEENFVWLIAGLDEAGGLSGLRAFLYLGADFAETGVVTGADFVTSSSKERY